MLLEVLRSPQPHPPPSIIIQGLKFPLQPARLLESGLALSEISLCLSQTNLC